MANYKIAKSSYPNCVKLCQVFLCPLVNAVTVCISNLTWLTAHSCSVLPVLEAILPGGFQNNWLSLATDPVTFIEKEHWGLTGSLLVTFVCTVLGMCSCSQFKGNAVISQIKWS